MSNAVSVITRSGIRRAVAGCLVVIAALAVTAGSSSATTVGFTLAPTLPGLNGVTLNGQTQSTSTTWTMTNNMKITSSGTNTGWHLNVGANTTGGTHSAVFKQYCPNATCGSDTGPGYVSGGQTLAANSLTLTSTGASFSGQNGTTGTAPTLQCASACNVDSGSAVKIASAAAGTGMGTWATTGWGGTSLALSTPSTLKTLQSNEVYRVDLVWTINSGP